MNRTHGMHRSPTWMSWMSMVQRCTNPNAADYPDYGGRGVKVCAAWRSFENFFADMGVRPEGLTIERKDNDGNYEPSNCRWATPKEQRANQRPQRLQARNKTGVIGVYWDERSRRYEAKCRGHLGHTRDFFEAVCMRKSAELRFSNPTTT